MGLKKGMTNNPKGRPVGSNNRISASMRERINFFLEENFNVVEESFNLLEPKDKLLFYTKLLSYGVPVLKAIEHTTETQSNLEKMSTNQLNTLIAKILDEEGR